MLEAARAESQALSSKLAKSLEEERQRMNAEVKKKVEKGEFEITGHVLSDLGSASLDGQIIQVFIKRLNNLGDSGQKQFRKAFDIAGGAVLIKTAFDLQPAEKQPLENAVNQVVGKKSVFQYAVDANLLSGIELSVRDFKLSWNIESYLAGLESSIIMPAPDQIKKEENAI